MIRTHHKWHGECELLSLDGKYCIIKFFNGKAFEIKRVQKRMISSHDYSSIPAIKNNPYLYTQALREWAGEISRLKKEVSDSLGKENKIKWEAMNSQQKKIFVFRAMELGFITWEIEGSKKIAIN